MKSVEKIKHIVAHPMMGTQCPNCEFFKESNYFKKFSWFGLRKNTSTDLSFKFAVCAAYGTYASIARRYDCNGRDFEPKKD